MPVMPSENMACVQRNGCRWIWQSGCFTALSLIWK
uniref:Uncharacterized protein n=1 Tax=Myoviridae sp. ctxZp7 TaxID=2823554 RepID=A0A8S5L675_9CAUD|nr:MAG TPA: hypothetical protein [Myoviridae sp. ctxZp7]